MSIKLRLTAWLKESGAEGFDLSLNKGGLWPDASEEPKWRDGSAWFLGESRAFLGPWVGGGGQLHEAAGQPLDQQDDLWPEPVVSTKDFV